jgi:distribution and morphology protein 34
MSLKFNWPAFTLEQINLAKEQLTIALNLGAKAPNIVGDVKITDLNLGTKAPELTCVSLDDLQASSKFPRSKVMLHLLYDGDAHLVLQTLVQVNPLSKSKNDIRPWDYMVAANQPLIVPLNIKIAEIRLKGIISFAFDVEQGVTIKFKSENPLTSLLVSSSFDHVDSIKKVLQEQIENQIKSLFKTDLPLIIYRLSQTFVKERSRESSPIKLKLDSHSERYQDATSSREFYSGDKSHKGM